ncbi:ATP-binding protein [Actinophytocola sediminis]
MGNEISGSVAGAVVQAGTIHQVILPGREVPVPRQLPSAVRDFTGRDRELAALDEVLASAGDPAATVVVAVIDGVGGAGKTTLVVKWAHRAQRRFPGGTLFVNLRGFGPSPPLDPAMVLALFLPALGLAETQVPAEFEARVGLYRSVLAERRVLVVLDNAVDAEQVRPLLPGAPGCMAVVTSRGGLTELVIAEAAHRVPLDVFSTAESTALLREILGTERIDAELDAAAELLAVCGGLPLAVRVAATRVAAHPHVDIADVVAEITGDQHRRAEDTLWGNDVGSAVRAVFDWSYERLTDQQAMVFRRLGLHPSPEFGVAAAAALAGLGSGAAYRCLAALAELHLIEPVARRRFRMHDLMHAHAAHRVELDEPPGDRDAAVARMLSWYARTAWHADQTAFPEMAGTVPAVVGPVDVEAAFADREQARAWLHAEHANLVAAARGANARGLHDQAMALAVACRFLTSGGRAWYALHLEATEAGTASAGAAGHRVLEALLLSMRAGTLGHLDRWDDADVAVTRALTLAEELADPARLVSGLSGLGRVRRGQRRLSEAGEYYRRSAAVAREAGLTRSEAVALCNLSAICTDLGEFDQALAYAEQELVLRRQAGDQVGEAGALCDAGLAWQGLGRHDTAISLFQQAIESYRVLRYTGRDLVQTVLALAVSQEHLRDWPAAMSTTRAAIGLLDDLEDPRARQARGRLAELTAMAAEEPDT